MARSPDADPGARRLVGLLLRAGLAAGALFMAIGLVLAISEGRLRSHPVRLGELARFIASGRPSGFMAAGVLVLVAAPLARVAALAATFALERDRRFALVALAVATILAFGIVGARL
jgi:uncharacterized membrane protein